MLAITRYPKQSIKIDGPCEVFVIKIKGGQVRIGIKAPESTRIVRAELEDARADKATDCLCQGGGEREARTPSLPISDQFPVWDQSATNGGKR